MWLKYNSGYRPKMKLKRSAKNSVKKKIIIQLYQEILIKVLNTFAIFKCGISKLDKNVYQ
jgi:hypothetical protein